MTEWFPAPISEKDERFMYLMQNFYIFVTSFFMSLIMVPPIRRWALDCGAVDEPGGRKDHVGAVPRVGGIAIFVPFLFSLLVYFEMTREVRGILAGALILFVTGLIDDLCSLSPRQKLFGQISGTLVTVLVGHLYLVNLGDLLGFGPITLPVWFSVPFTVFAVVGVVNAVNLIDGLDGLAGGISVIALSSFFLFGLKEHNFSVLAITSSLLGATFGFLRYNAHPARIFMGDTGSLVVGFLLGFSAIALTQADGANVHPVAALLILGVPVSDALLVMAKRVAKGGNPWKADRSHLHHRILGLGVKPKTTVLIICSFSLFLSLCALALHGLPEWASFTIYISVSILYFIILESTSFYERFDFALFARIPAFFSWVFRKLNVVRLESFVAQTLVFLICFYLALAVFVCGDAGGYLLGFSSLIFASGLVLFFLGKEIEVFLTLVYLAAVVVVFQVEQIGSRVLAGGVTVDHFTNILFIVIAFLVSALFLSPRGRDKFFDTQLDFLVLFMSLALAVVSPSLDLYYSLSGVVSKGIVLFVALKLVSVAGRRVPRFAACSVLAALFAIVVRGVSAL